MGDYRVVGRLRGKPTASNAAEITGATAAEWRRKERGRALILPAAGEFVNNGIHLEDLFSASKRTPEQQVVLFALLNLGIIESLANGLVSATDVLQVFYNAENCLFVRKRLREKTTNAIMSHGVQLPDLFDALPTEEAHRQFQRGSRSCRTLCLKLLEEKCLVA